MTMMRGSMNKQITEAPMGQKGLWYNIQAKKKRIEEGSGERMRRKGEKGAPTEEAIKKSQGKAKGGMVRYKNGGCVMAGRGVRNTHMG